MHRSIFRENLSFLQNYDIETTREKCLRHFIFWQSLLTVYIYIWLFIHKFVYNPQFMNNNAHIDGHFYDIY